MDRFIRSSWRLPYGRNPDGNHTIGDGLRTGNPKRGPTQKIEAMGVCVPSRGHS